MRNLIKVITAPRTRWSYANIWEPKSINGSNPKYSVSLIIPKDDTVTVGKIKAAIQAAYEDGQVKLKGNSRSIPALTVIKTPLRDGDLERPDNAAYANSYFVNANSTTAPGVVDADRNPILTRSEVYSGVFGRASINFYAYNSNGNRGIACGLNKPQQTENSKYAMRTWLLRLGFIGDEFATARDLLTLRLAGERTSSEMSELFVLARKQRYGACEDENQVLQKGLNAHEKKIPHRLWKQPEHPPDADPLPQCQNRRRVHHPQLQAVVQGEHNGHLPDH